MHVGFSGTQNGMTDAQSEKVEEILRDILRQEIPKSIKVGGPRGSHVDEHFELVLHHGDCVGADEDVHQMIRRCLPTYRITIHPPTDEKKRAFMKGDITFPTHDYLTRNRMIVLSSDVLLAAPGSEEVLRSGTWFTIRYARERKIPIIIVLPHGSVSREGRR
jgi:hypothetical protein